MTTQASERQIREAVEDARIAEAEDALNRAHDVALEREEKMKHSRQCVECSRHFNMDLLHDAEEWAYGHNCEVGYANPFPLRQPNYADQRAMALRAVADTLIMERK